MWPDSRDVGLCAVLAQVALAWISDEAGSVAVRKGDRSITNPTTTALIRAGRLTDRTTLYRTDLAQTSDPRGMPKNPHNFLLDGVDTAERPFALAAQRQIAIFLKTEGAQTLDPDGDGPIFETPIKGALPEDLGFSP